MTDPTETATTSQTPDTTRPITSVPSIIEHWARVRPEKVCLTQAGFEVTYQELDRRSNQVAHALLADGVAGRHVGYLGKNDVRFFELWFGANKAGSAIAPFNWRCSAAELAQLIDDARIPVLVLDREFLSVVQQAIEQVSFDVEIVVFAPDRTPDDYDGWLRDRPTTPVDVTPAASDTALLAYTSGTTGRPKGVQLSQAAFAESFLTCEEEPSLRWRETDVALMVMPAFHLAGSWVNLQALYHGGTIAIIAMFEPQALLSALAEVRPTIICMVPAAIQMLIEHPQSADVDFSGLRRIIYAGSPISVETLAAAMALFGCEFVQFYGATEMWIMTILRPEQHRTDRPEILTSCGTPVRGVTIRIVGPDGRDVEDGEVGELWVRSSTTFSGYWDQPDVTAQALDEDGWYHTGDLGRRDAEGHFYIVDRVKDMIISGGENVYSVEVERALYEHPAVLSAAVVGIPDPRWGEKVTAYVVLEEGSQLTENDLQEHCRRLIARYKVPKLIVFEKALPMTPSGKIQKAVLRKQEVV